MPAPQIIEIYTDGACSGNPGPGGWGALLRIGEKEREINGGETQTTNNRMEMMAAIQALEAIISMLSLMIWASASTPGVLKTARIST